MFFVENIKGKLYTAVAATAWQWQSDKSCEHYSNKLSIARTNAKLNV